MTMSKTGVFGIAFFLALGGGLIFRLTADPEVDQPIRFNHQIHIENGLDCTDCHRGAESSMRATIPPLEVCADCHEEALGESTEEALVVTHVIESRPIAWKRVSLLPEHVFFSHRRHTEAGELDCVACHEDVAVLDEPPRRALLLRDMDDCVQCHESRDVTNDCNACHR